MVGQTISDSKNLERAGSGGIGEVYRAEDLKLGHHVALKFLAGGFPFRELTHEARETGFSPTALWGGFFIPFFLRSLTLGDGG